LPDDSSKFFGNGTKGIKAYSFVPLSSSSVEDNWDGKLALSVFEKLKDQFSRLPSNFHAQILVSREEARKEKNKPSIFETVGFVTKFFLIESDSGQLNQFSLAGIFLDLGLELQPLSPEELDRLPQHLFACADKQTLSDVLWEADHIKVGDKFIRAISLTDAPSYTWPGFLQGIFECERPLVASLQISIPDKTKARRKLETKRKINHALSARSIHQVDDIEADSAFESSHLTLERMTSGRECLTQFSLSVFLNSKNLQSLNEDCEQLTTQFDGDSGCGFYAEELGSFLVFKSHMPAAKPLAVRQLPMLSGNLIHLLPIFFDFNRSQVPTELSVISRCSERCNLNLFNPDNLNFNAFVCGSSGSGKSFLLNAFIAAFVKQFANSRVFLFDVGSSYKKLILSMDGDYRVLKPQKAKALIVTLLRKTALGVDDYTRVLIENLCGNSSNVTHSHKVAIQNLTHECEGRPFRFRELVATAMKKSEAVYKDIVLWLEPYLHWDEIPSEQSLLGEGQSRFTGFDFKELESDLQIQKLVVLSLAKYVWDEVKNSNGVPTLVVFDEVWKFFACSSSVIEEMYRTFRKYNAGIVSITQSLADYGDAAFAKLIIANSFTRLVLQGGANSSQLTGALDLDSEAIGRILSLASQKNRYSEFWVGTPQFSQVMRLIPSEMLFNLANSEPVIQIERRSSA
jgi:type IV secretory pathway VirB4 component